MTKFCKYCGKEIKKDEKCSCDKAVSKQKKEFEKAKDTIKEEVSSSSKIYIKKLGNIVQNIFADPKETADNFVKEGNGVLTSIILLLSSLIISFCIISFLKGFYSDVSPYSFATQYSTRTINQMWNFSYFKILCCIFLGLLIGYAILAVIFNIGFEKISKNNITFKKTLSIIAISLVEPTILFVLSAFMTIFSYKIAIILVLYLIILFMLNLYGNFKQIAESKHYNQIFSILIILFCFLAIYLIPNLFL